jgi:uncharacterized protein (DUF1810 family)
MDEARAREFIAAQDQCYDRVIAELTEGRKRTHWMWFIFPQLAGLGSSGMAVKYALTSVAEAREYLQHDVLSSRLRECTGLVLAIPDRAIERIFGYPDDLKFHSSMTLFSLADPSEPLFPAALDRFYGGARDSLTLELVR